MSITISYSRNFHNKTITAPNDASGKNTWAFGKFETITVIPEAITKHALRGGAISVGVYKGGERAEKNFISAQLIGVDIDHDVTFENVLRDEYVNRHAFFVYTTASSTPHEHRCRVLFILDIPVTDVEQYRRLTKRLLHRFAKHFDVDTSCKDAARIFYGSDNAHLHHEALENVLPVSYIDELEPHPDEFPKPIPERPATIIATPGVMNRALAYGKASREREINDVLATPAGLSQRHAAFNGFVMSMISKVKGGWPGFENIEADIRYVGERMGREKSEIERSIKGAWEKSESQPLSIPDTPMSGVVQSDVPESPSDSPSDVSIASSPMQPHTQSLLPPPSAGIAWKTSDDSMARYRDRLKTAQSTYVPLPFPMRSLWEFGGFCRAVSPGILIGVVGASGGMKTSFLETITDAWRQMGENHILWWGSEWSWEKMADRAIQRYGETDMPTAGVTEMMLHEMWLAEEASNIAPSQRFGVKLSKDVYAASETTTYLIENWPGKSHFVDHMDIDFDTLVEAFIYRVTELEKIGQRPKVAVFDYIQLLNVKGLRNELDRATYAQSRIKALCVDHKLIGVVASQVTKITGTDMRENQQILDGESGQFLRSDKFNLVLTLNPVYENGLLTDNGIINVAKNSAGRPGRQSVGIDPSRFKWIDRKSSDNVTSFKEASSW